LLLPLLIVISPNLIIGAKIGNNSESCKELERIFTNRGNEVISCSETACGKGFEARYLFLAEVTSR